LFSRSDWSRAAIELRTPCALAPGDVH